MKEQLLRAKQNWKTDRSVGKVKKKNCLYFKKSSISDIIFKCLHLFPFHKLLISNLYTVLTKQMLPMQNDNQLVRPSSMPIPCLLICSDINRRKQRERWEELAIFSSMKNHFTCLNYCRSFFNCHRLASKRHGKKYLWQKPNVTSEVTWASDRKPVSHTSTDNRILCISASFPR